MEMKALFYHRLIPNGLMRDSRQSKRADYNSYTGASYRRQFPLKSCRLASQRCEPDAFQSSARWKNEASSHHAPPRKTRDYRPRHDLQRRIVGGVEISHPSSWPTVHDKTWLPPAFQKKDRFRPLSAPASKIMSSVYSSRAASISFSASL